MDISLSFFFYLHFFFFFIIPKVQLFCLHSRQPVFQLEQSELPAACSGHGAGEEELEEERPWPSDAGGFLLLVLHRKVSGCQFSVITQHGGRSADVPLFLPHRIPKAHLFVYLHPHPPPALFHFYYLEENFCQMICQHGD